ncbi:M48 family metallopeptidase [Aurantiacibacter sp. D1-12]|uniref:M48 family metallopeptidase n=1 Tax=Aurantiacibacter sp. D1-12 TaxID=2993658 RepID=UPI00237CDA12|nr:M48 family metallopeptidase [Aurantiacibacter sp. D1-12]MDE1466783.1 M48 family metallopeptidase [Aurantiacibacter sp. D1-12]
MTANASLCRDLMPGTGMVLHSRDQYRSDGADRRFSNGAVAVSAVVPGSAAAQAGVARDDGLIAINGRAISELPQPETGNLRELVFDLLASHPVDQPLSLTIARAGEQRTVTISAPPACRSLVEIRLGNGPRAISDGRVIQIRFDFARSVSDEELAVIFAHELAHSVLEHRRRKEDAGIAVGFMGELGRNQRANRQAEVEADRLSVHLLANAGYDPGAAPVFWRTGSGRELGGGLLGSTIYPSNTARAELLENEIAMYLPLGRGPSWPGHLLIMRDRSFSLD